MATTTEVKKSLDDIATIIITERQAFANAKARIQSSSNNLNAITSQYAGVISTIDAYVPEGAFETLSKDERARLGAEFTALKTEIDTLIASF